MLPLSHSQALLMNRTEEELPHIATSHEGVSMKFQQNSNGFPMNCEKRQPQLTLIRNATDTHLKIIWKTNKILMTLNFLYKV